MGDQAEDSNLHTIQVRLWQDPRSQIRQELFVPMNLQYQDPSWIGISSSMPGVTEVVPPTLRQSDELMNPLEPSKAHQNLGNDIQPIQSIESFPPSYSVMASDALNETSRSGKGTHESNGSKATYSDETWGMLKEELRQLYIEQQRPLRSVMKIMSWRRNFKASERMYKEKIKKWGWKKNLTTKNNGTATIKPRNLQRLRCRAGPTYVSNLPGIQVPMSDFLAPDQYEKINRSIHGYIDGLFCTLNQCQNASIFIVLNSQRQAFYSIHKLFEEATLLIGHDDPMILVNFWPICISLLGLCVRMTKHKLDILYEFINQMRQRILDRHGDGHPLFLLLDSLRRVRSRLLPTKMTHAQTETEFTKMKQALQIGYEMTIRSFETVIGADHPIVLHMWTTYFRYSNTARLDRPAFWKNYKRLGAQARKPNVPLECTMAVLYQYAYAILHVGGTDGELIAKNHTQNPKPKGRKRRAEASVPVSQKCQHCYDNARDCVWARQNAKKNQEKKCNLCFRMKLQCNPVQKNADGTLPVPEQFADVLLELSKDL
ncbi:uncharacterized protein BDZ99DRAFT_519192 [Mytilinidion resinicola]|uniref:Clr5 domain-containing protein n=1 Tax=Mytilinidion resinicola TaxID=574789 RepID=A0A6A6YSQ0_9PEZI|nr:uncharacterized protein BDZ99DRAFT_519192 [Mytilinidion resinicola]KAF2811952.1 hypothetical protein BDZ99DRAFT_519192 [Mytilinidion resinicola]